MWAQLKDFAKCDKYSSSFVKEDKHIPRVSVIVPNYNHGLYLDQRIQSILHQSYQDFETIILDDCSTDSSVDIIRKYSDDRHISQIIINRENSGNTFIQWQRGILLAKGELIWIAESDDYCGPTMLEELVNAYDKNKETILAYSTLTLVDENGSVTFSPRQYRNQYFTSAQYLRRYLSMANFVRNASCAIFSRQAALNVSLDYLKYPSAGDYLFWVEISKQGKVAIVNKGLSYFRRHSGVVTEKRDYDGTNFTAEKEILAKILSYISIMPLREKYIYAYHCRRVMTTSYNSDDTRKKLYSLWEVDNNSGVLAQIILKVTDVVRNRLNIYL